MSAKGRGPRPDNPNEYFPTPAWVVWRLIEKHHAQLFGGVGRRQILEPTVGDGAIVFAMAMCLSPHDNITGVELRKGALDPRLKLGRHVEGVSFLDWEPWPIPNGVYDLTIGNPPFSLAEPIIRHAMSMSRIVVMLLPLNFLGSEERVPFWREFPRPAVRVIPERVSFDGTGSDMQNVAWFIWGSALEGVDVLDTTPLEIRNAQKPTGLPVNIPSPPQLNIFDNGRF